ncbi:MAG: ABC transporter permease [Planctomycetes bacterium]|nr:ABC transporter permease [Planctomycetota bacterium]
MGRYVATRLLLALPTLLLILGVVFAVVHAVPPVPSVEIDSNVDLRSVTRQFRREFGLDLPVFVNTRPWTDVDDVLALLDANDEDAMLELRRFAVVPLLALSEPGQERSIEAWTWLGRCVPEDVDPREPETDRARKRERNSAWAIVTSRSAAERVGAAREFVAARLDHYAPQGLDTVRVMFGETQFATYLGRVLRLDFGVSVHDRKPVFDTLVGRLKYSIGISFGAILLAYVFAIPLGVLSALWRGTRKDAVLSAALFSLYSLPSFFVATILLRVFTVGEPFSWFPPGGFHSARGFDAMTPWERVLDVAQHLALPIVCLAYPSLAYLSRYVRSSMLDALGSDWVRTARAKGLSQRAVVVGHALRNALLPLVTLVGNVLPAVFGGALVIEVVFDIPGVGSGLYQAIVQRDPNLILCGTLLLSVLTLAGYLVSDVLYSFVDPRIRFGERSPRVGTERVR